MKAKQLWKTTKMNNSEIQRLHRILEVRREETLRSLNQLGDATRSVHSDYPQDIADLCTATLSKESLFQQSGERRRMLRLIEAALARIHQGTFGVCVACGDDINPRRLDALPWTQYCFRCQEASEQGQEMECSSGSADSQVPLKKAG